jgi:3'-phosphoadenosine 5'-phosphosulfate sulfotransferase (PAPS reductase)/FAD synthetase
VLKKDSVVLVALAWSLCDDLAVFMVVTADCYKSNKM